MKEVTVHIFFYLRDNNIHTLNHVFCLVRLTWTTAGSTMYVQLVLQLDKYIT